MTGRSGTREAAERGLGLIELLVAIAILGLAVVGLFESLTTLLASSDRVRKRTDVNALLVSAGEYVRDQGTVPFRDCANVGSPPNYSLAGFTVPSSLQVTIASVEQWTGSDFLPTTPTCTATTVGDARRVQRITLSAQTGDSRASSTLQVVKRES